MIIKKQKGLVGADIIIAVITIMIFSTLILTMIYNNTLENVKLKKEALAMIYVTEIFENVGIEKYENVTAEKIKSSLSDNVKKNFDVGVSVTNISDSISGVEDIIKKVELTLTYEIDGKKYNCSMERMKVKE